MRAKKAAPPEIPPDPFHERELPASRVRMQLLGGRFEFECGNPELRRLVDWAYADLPRHKLSAVPPRIRVRARAGAARPRPGAARSTSYRDAWGSRDAVRNDKRLGLCSHVPGFRSALVVVSQEMLRFEYHTRYELIEFAVFTLAARSQGLIPLHGACVGADGRGLLLIGDSGAGKSTASLQCLLHGMDFVTEDSVFVTPDTLLATGIANFLHIRCDSLHSVPPAAESLIRHSPVIRRRSGVEKFEVDLRQPPFSTGGAPAASRSCRVHVPTAGARRGALEATSSRCGRRSLAQESTLRPPVSPDGPCSVSVWLLFRRSSCVGAATRPTLPPHCRGCWPVVSFVSAEGAAASIYHGCAWPSAMRTASMV